MNIKPISGGVKPSLIETLDNIAESYNDNYIKTVEALNQARLDHSYVLIKEFEDDRDYWIWEYGKIDMIRNIIRDYPEIDGAAYRVIAETENETVSEAI